jgi:putative ABC transport system substrate-binding protein
MRRRDFIKGIAGSATTWPLAARAQQQSKLPTIGFLGGDAKSFSSWTAAFVARLRELGWIEGQTIAIEYRWSEGRPQLAAEFAAEIVRRKVDVIVTVGTYVAALKQATSVIPIVFAVAIDPLGAGFVASLAHPGGNVTGLSVQAADLAGKRLEILREVVPNLHRVAVMFDANYRGSVVTVAEFQAAARTLGLEVAALEIRRAEDIAPAFETLKTEARALYIVQDALTVANRTRIITLGLSARVPTIFDEREWVQGGGLLSYGAMYPALFRRAAELVDKILRGAKPADLPIEQPTKFELVINLTTAKALGLTIPASLMSLADELIE